MLKTTKEVGLNRIIKYFFTEIWQLIFLSLPYSPLRVFWLRLGGAKIGNNCFIDRVWFMNLDRMGLVGLKIGAECYLGPLVLLDLAGKITVENQVTIAAKTTILSHHSVGYNQHPLTKFYPKKVSQTRIMAGSVLSVNCTVLPGITIGRETMIGAGALVNQDVPDRVLAVGVPVSIKKTFNEA